MARKPIPAEVPETVADLPPRTHNLPSASLSLSDEQWREWLDHVFEGPAGRKAELLPSFERFAEKYPTIPDRDVHGRAGDLAEKLKALLKMAENLHSIEKAPVLVAQRAVDGFLKGFRAPLDNALVIINARRTEYAKRLEREAREKAQEDARKRQAEADALAAKAAETMETDALQESADAAARADEAAKVAAAPAAELSRTYGPMNSVSSLRTTYRFDPEQSNLLELAKAVIAGKAPIEYLAFDATRIGFDVRSGKPPLRDGMVPGIVVAKEMKI